MWEANQDVLLFKKAGFLSHGLGSMSRVRASVEEIEISYRGGQ